MKVKDVMTTDVRTVTQETPLKETAELLAELGISGLPVVEGGLVVGVVSEADILLKERGVNPSRRGLLGLVLDAAAAVEEKLHARTAGEAMTSPAITIGPERPLAEAAARMIDERVNRLPVVDEQDRLVGIVTRADLVRAFVRADHEIEREIREDVLLRILWIPPELIAVKVENGEVTLAGQVETKGEAELAEAFARKVPGVVSVTSKLRWQAEDGGRNATRSAWTLG
jgi:CBS domain-containing protein